MRTTDSDSLRVLVLTPLGRDGGLTCELLAAHKIECFECTSASHLVDEIERGAGAAIIAREALTRPAEALLASALARQASWSDFPIVLIGDRVEKAPEDRIGELGNVNLLDRPVRVRTMIAAVKAGLRARKRQYAARREIHSRDEFLAMLGHELRNPLGAIALGADLLRASDEPESRERQRDVIARQARHLARLVDDLLDVARVTHGKITLMKSLVDVGEVAAAVLQTLEATARASGVRVSTKIEAGVLADVDRVRIEQIFSNLLTNAIKYTPQGGAVQVEVRRDGDTAVVTFDDTGIGIEADLLERIFDVFAQADQGLDRARGGMGLGLTVARNLVRLHGGDIEASSRGSGRGSTFVVRLPTAAASAASAPPPDAGVDTPRRIVVVEDSTDHRELLALLLERRGHEVTTASDGPEGLASILEAKPDLALVDIGLPGFDGLELARRVRAAGGDGITLVALSGYGRQEDKQNARSAGFDMHLTKPVDEKRLVEALKAMRAAKREPVRLSNE